MKNLKKKLEERLMFTNPSRKTLLKVNMSLLRGLAESKEWVKKARSDFDDSVSNYLNFLEELLEENK